MLVESYLLPLLLIAFFGLLEWLMIFFETYRHFPKMEKIQRIQMSFVTATELALFISILCYVTLYLIMGGLSK
jgi:hypothetical protein